MPPGNLSADATPMAALSSPLKSHREPLKRKPWAVCSYVCSEKVFKSTEYGLDDAFLEGKDCLRSIGWARIE